MKSRSVVLFCVLGGLAVAAGVPLAILGISHALAPRKNSDPNLARKQEDRFGGPRAVAPMDPAPFGMFPEQDFDLDFPDVAGPGFDPIAPAAVGQVVAPEEVKALQGTPVRAAKKISGPFTHANLSVFLVHGPKGEARPMLTLKEGLESGQVTLHAAPVSIDNRSDKPLFLQGGDIIKGGTQDRVIPYDQLIPARSVRVPLNVLCVEQGRSFPRAGESSVNFALSTDRLPTKELRLAAFNYSQGEVWTHVRGLQQKLLNNLGGSVKAPLSPTSLQLTLEHSLVWNASDKYVDPLEAAIKDQEDVVGLVVAVNGKVVSGDIYASPALFQKFRHKLLRAAAVDALANPGAGSEVEVARVETFLSPAGSAPVTRHTPGGSAHTLRHDYGTALVYDTCEAGGEVLHRGILAR